VIIRFSPQYFAIQNKYIQKQIKMNNDFNNINNSQIMNNGYELTGIKRKKLIKDEHLYYVKNDKQHVYIMQITLRTGASDYIVNAFSINEYLGQSKNELIEYCEKRCEIFNAEIKKNYHKDFKEIVPNIKSINEL